MKKSIWLGCLFAIAVVGYSCKSSNTPSKVAEEFATAMVRSDFTTAKTLVTENDKAMLDQGEEMSKSTPMADSLKTILDGAKITSSNEKIENDSTATVDVKINYNKEIMGRKESTDTYVLKKVGGNWKIDMEATIKKVMESYGNGMAPAQGQGMDDSLAGEAPAQDSLNQ